MASRTEWDGRTKMLSGHYTQQLQSRRIAFAGSLVVLLPVFFPSLFTPIGRSFPSLFSEWNAPKPRHLHLLEAALNRNISVGLQSELWSPLPHQGWVPCSQSDLPYDPLPEKSRGYIQVFLDGGLNQQRMGICDAVAVAKLLNATLLIPHFEVNPVWKDSSSFSEIFDVNHFINVLQDDVRIIKELPSDFSWSTREYYATGIRATRIKTAPVHASATWYSENVAPVLNRYGIAAISPFSHRLTFEELPEKIQRLRCKANFEALKFIPKIEKFGENLINRLRFTSNEEKPRKYVVLHLRFDKDMAAHSACDFGGGKAERLALAKYRQQIWQGRVLNSKFSDKDLRRKGRCPLTPEEIALLLSALGFDNNTRLYLASHKVYGGEARIASLKKLFPFVEDKRSLTKPGELSEIEGKSSVLAAVDYFVAMKSDVFISASPGNMHNALVGHRTYFNMKTIRPNMVLLGPLFENKSATWHEFEAAVVKEHRGRYGQIRLRKDSQSIYTYPAPDCMCQASYL